MKALTHADLIREAYDVARMRLGPLAAVSALQASTLGQFSREDMERALVHTREFPAALPITDLPPTEPVEFAVDEWATAREPVIIVGDDGSGKTTILLKVLTAMAAGEPAFDRFAVTAGPVLMVSEEDSAPVIVNHVEAIARGHGWDLDLIRSRFHVLALAGVQLDKPAWQEHVLSEVRRTGAVGVGLDPLHDLTEGEENSNDQTRPLKAFVRDVCKAGATPFVVHHAGKPKEGGRKRDRVRGASALLAMARSAWFVEENEMGIAVESLKLSRSERPAPFVVSRAIESDPDNPGNWHTARLSYVSERDAEEDTAERFILDNLERYPFTKSTEIRELAKGTGLNAPQIAAALKRLHLLRKVDFRPGARNAKEWFRPDLVTLPDGKGNLPENSRQAGQATLPSLSEPARQARGGTDEPAPLDREGRVGKVADRLRQADGFTCVCGCGRDVGGPGVVHIECREVA
jgi:hypothetical protein